MPFHSVQVPFNSYRVAIRSSSASSEPISFDSAFCLPDSDCGLGQLHSRHAQSLERKECLELVQTAREVPSFLGGRFHDYALNAKLSRTLLRCDRDDGNFLSALDGSKYEVFRLQNDFSRDTPYRSRHDFEVALPKAGSELPGGEKLANNSRYYYDSERQVYVRECTQNGNAALTTLDVSAPQQSNMSSSVSTPVPTQVLKPLTAFLPLPDQLLIASATIPAPSVSSVQLCASTPALAPKSESGTASASTSSKQRDATPVSLAPVMHCTVPKTPAVSTSPTRGWGRQSSTPAETRIGIAGASERESPTRHTHSQQRSAGVNAANTTPK